MSIAPFKALETWYSGIVTLRGLPSDIADEVKSRLRGAVVDAVSSLGGAIGSFVWSVTNVIVSFVVDFMSTVFNRMVELTNKVVPQMVRTMSSLVNQILDNANVFGEALKSGFLSTFGWSVDESRKALDDIARIVVPWYQVGESRFAGASAKALVTYWLLSRLENVISGRGGLLGTLFGILTFPFYLKLVSGIVPVVSEVVYGVSRAPAVRTFTAPSPPPVVEYEAGVPEMERMALGGLATGENRYVGGVRALGSYVFGGWQS